MTAKNKTAMKARAKNATAKKPASTKSGTKKGATTKSARTKKRKQRSGAAATSKPTTIPSGAKSATSKQSGPLVAAERALRELGMSYPEVSEHFPWGHRTLKVKTKAFVFMGIENSRFFFSVKLPQSAPGALMFKWCQPTGYGLGKAGWVTAELNEGDTVPVDLLKEWLAESYRAVAPKKLAAQI